MISADLAFFVVARFFFTVFTSGISISLSFVIGGVTFFELARFLGVFGYS